MKNDISCKKTTYLPLSNQRYAFIRIFFVINCMIFSNCADGCQQKQPICHRMHQFCSSKLIGMVAKIHTMPSLKQYFDK